MMPVIMSGPASPWHRGGWRFLTCPRAATCRCTAATAATGSCTTARSTTIASSEPGWRTADTPSSRIQTRRFCSICSSTRDPRCSIASMACSRLPSGTASTAPCSWRVTGSGSNRCISSAVAMRSPLPQKRRRCSPAVRRPRGLMPTRGKSCCASATSPATGHLSLASSVCSRATGSA